MTLLHPTWLLLLLVVPVIWFVPRRLRDTRLGLLRTAVLVLLVLGAARPVAWTTGGPAWQVVVLDASGSVDPAARTAAIERADGIADALPGGTRSVLISYGVDAPSTAFDRVVPMLQLTDSSPLAHALGAAARAIPAGARGAVTVLSTGYADERTWARATQQLTARGIPVHVVEVPARRRRAAIVGLDVPQTLRVGAQATFGVRVDGYDATARVRLRLFELFEPGGPVDEVVVEGVRLGGVDTVAVTIEPTRPGFFKVQAEIEVTSGSDDAEDLQDNAMVDYAAVQDPLRILYFGERMAEGGPRLSGMLGRGFELTLPDGDEDTLAAEVGRSDLVVIDDAPADSVPTKVQAAIRDGVANGTTGLFVSGGRASFGAGGWHRSPIASVLPVEMVQKEEKRDPSTTLVVIIDTSGSMGGNRVQLAKEVSRLAIRRLLPHDKVGIVEFYGAKRWAAPIQPASNAIEIQRALNRLNAGGGTVIMPAIEEAFYGLQNVRTRYKHVLVLTDGGVETGAFEPLLRRMAEKGITVSTVLIGGSTHSEFLVNLANWGKGRFYGVPNRFNLPEILLKQPASAHLPAWRPGTHALTAKGGPGWWGSIEASSIPPITGYVEGRARKGASVLLEATATKHPVLATWRHGLGRVTTLMTEPTGPGTAPWSDWKDQGELLARVLARTASDTRRPYAFHTEQRDGAAVVVARQLHRGVPAPEGRLLGYKEIIQGGPLVFRRRAPDLFESQPIGSYMAARVLAGVPGLPPQRVAVPNTTRFGRQRIRAEALDLFDLAQATGGKHMALADGDPFVPAAGGGDDPVDVQPLWPYCLLLALLVWLGELFYRRRPRASAGEGGAV